MDRKTNLAIVEANRLYRESLCSALNQIADFHIVCDEDTVDDLVENPADKLIDLMLISVEVEKRHGYDALKKIRKLFPVMKILALLDYPENCFYQNALTKGANDALSKFSSKEVIEQHIRCNIEKNSPYKNEPFVTQCTE